MILSLVVAMVTIFFFLISDKQQQKKRLNRGLCMEYSYMITTNFYLISLLVSE